MKRLVFYYTFIFTVIFSIGATSSADTVISNKLLELCVTGQSFISATSQPGSLKTTARSKSGYLILEMSGTIAYEALEVFANDFLLVSETSDGFKHSTVAKFIGFPGEPIQPSLAKPFAEMEDHIRVENGQARFWVVFYLPFAITPISLLYFGSWPVIYRVPFTVCPETKSVKVAGCP
jgi:hypothetical protein